jgi:hypothetical protein
MDRDDAERYAAEIEALPESTPDDLPPEARDRVRMVELVRELDLDPATVTWGELVAALRERGRREDH